MGQTNYCHATGGIIMRNWIARFNPAWRAVLVVALVALSVGPLVSTALADVLPPATVNRVLPAAVNPGQQFEVTMTFTSPADNFNAIGLSDFAPSGWAVAADKTWCSPAADTELVTGNRTDYVWYGPYDTGQAFVAVYKVTVPAEALAGDYMFGAGVPGAQIEYYIGGVKHIGPFGGDAVITVTNDPIVPPVNVVRDLPETAGKGETFPVTVTFQAPADEFNATGLSDFAPDGWVITADETWCDPDALAYNVVGKRVDYAWDGPFTSGTQFTAVYNVTVPADADPGFYTFGVGDQETPLGQLEYYVGLELATALISGDTQVQILEGPAPLAVSTGTATVTGTTTATLNGNLDSLGEDTSADVYFEYQPVAGGDVLTTAEVNKTAVGAFTANIDGLTADTDYQFRAAADGTTTVYGQWVTFTTEASGQSVPIKLNPSQIGPIGVGDTFTLDVMTNVSSEQQISGADVFINFDSTKLEVVDADTVTEGVQVTSGTLLNIVMANTVDNSAGTIGFSAGKLGAPFPTGEFKIASIEFRALAETEPQTMVVFSFEGIRETVVVDELGSPISGDSFSTMVEITAGAVVNVSVGLQGNRSDAKWIIPLTVKFFTPGANVLVDNPVYSFTLDTVKIDTQAVVQCTGITFGTYDVTVVSDHTLLNVKKNVEISLPNVDLNMGTLLEGNVNNDGRINISDFGALSASYLKLVGDAAYNAMADFNGDGRVNISDFGLLSSNYLKVSPIVVP